MVLVKVKVLERETGEIKIIAEKMISYSDSIEFASYLVNKTNFKILKITIEEIEE